MPIFRVKSVKIYTGQKNLHWRRRPRRRQLSGMVKASSFRSTEVINRETYVYSKMYFHVYLHVLQCFSRKREALLGRCFIKYRYCGKTWTIELLVESDCTVCYLRWCKKSIYLFSLKRSQITWHPKSVFLFNWFFGFFNYNIWRHFSSFIECFLSQSLLSENPRIHSSGC